MLSDKSIGQFFLLFLLVDSNECVCCKIEVNVLSHGSRNMLCNHASYVRVHNKSSNLVVHIISSKKLNMRLCDNANDVQSRFRFTNRL